VAVCLPSSPDRNSPSNQTPCPLCNVSDRLDWPQRAFAEVRALEIAYPRLHVPVSTV